MGRAGSWVPAERPGSAGPTGATGATGLAGARGATGATGARGSQGSPGTPGQAGQNGTADAFGRIAADGIVNVPSSKNVSQADVTHPQTGVYCIGGLVVDGQPYSPKIAVGNGVAGNIGAVDGNGNVIPSPGSGTIIEAMALGDEADVTLALGPDTARVRVYTYSASSHALADRGFHEILSRQLERPF